MPILQQNLSEWIVSLVGKIQQPEAYGRRPASLILMLPAPYDMTATTFSGNSDGTSKLGKAMTVANILNNPHYLVNRVFTITKQRALDIEARDESQDDNKENTSVVVALLKVKSGRTVAVANEAHHSMRLSKVFQQDVTATQERMRDNPEGQLGSLLPKAKQKVASDMLRDALGKTTIKPTETQIVKIVSIPLLPDKRASASLSCALLTCYLLSYSSFLHSPPLPFFLLLYSLYPTLFHLTTL